MQPISNEELKASVQRAYHEGAPGSAARLLCSSPLQLSAEIAATRREMIDQLDRRAGWISGVERLQEFSEFATVMAAFHQSMGLGQSQG